MKIVWDNRFKRAFRKLIRKNPEFQERIINVLNLLSTDPFTASLKSQQKLQVLADFAAYLVNVESEAATQELLAIPGLLERIKQNQATPKTDYTNWRNIRSDERC